MNNKHHTPLTNEWNNSSYAYNKNSITKTLVVKNKFIYKLISCYFNIKKEVINIKKRRFSIVKVFINVQEIKHTNNDVFITLCVFNKEKIFVKKYIYRILSKTSFLTNKKDLGLWTKRIFKFYDLFYYKFKDLNIDINLFFKYKKYYVLYIQYISKKYIKLLILKKKIIKLKFINYKYNVSNILGIKNIIHKIYNKKVEINIINLKYLYLDSNILTEALGKKLKNRKAPLSKNIINSISFVRIPYVYWENINVKNIDLNSIILLGYFNSTFIKDIGTVKNSLYTHIQKLSIVLYNLKYKTIKGIKVEAAGRLTERLTAKRSIYKSLQKGTVKNVYSSHFSLSTAMLLGYVRSNLQYVKKNYNNRNGSYGIKTHISSY